MLQLGGRIEGLSSVPGSRAEVDLRGRLRNESPLSIAGTLNPLADPLFLDLKLDFTDIELSPLSPYSGTYVGYLIERGKLNVALAYLVENGKLTSTNKLFIDQFTFGDKVESDKATSLPVRLAVALLKDRKGEIHLDIPVSGSIDDPQFSVWGIVWQVIKNLLVKAVTSPLALLGALVGGGEDFSAIVFPAGSMQPDRGGAGQAGQDRRGPARQAGAQDRGQGLCRPRTGSGRLPSGAAAGEAPPREAHRPAPQTGRCRPGRCRRRGSDARRSIRSICGGSTRTRTSPSRATWSGWSSTSPMRNWRSCCWPTPKSAPRS